MSKSYKVAIIGNTGKDIRKAYSWFVRTTYQGLMLNGHKVSWLDYRTSSLKQIEQFLMEVKPQILFTHLTFHKQHHKPEAVMSVFNQIRKSFGTKIVHTLQDARTVPRYQGKISHAFDLALVGQTQTLKQMSKTWGIPTYYFPYSSLVYKKMGKFEKTLAYQNLLFLGNPDAHRDRSDFIKRLGRAMPLKIIRTKSPEDVRNKTLKVSASAKCILGACTGYTISGYQDVRNFQFLGAGAFMIIRKFKDMDNLIPPDLYIPFNGYTDSDVGYVRDQFNYWKNKDASKIRKRAFTYMQKYHSSKVRIGKVIKVIEGKSESIL